MQIETAQWLDSSYIIYPFYLVIHFDTAAVITVRSFVYLH